MARKRLIYIPTAQRNPKLTERQFSMIGRCGGESLMSFLSLKNDLKTYFSEWFGDFPIVPAKIWPPKVQYLVE